MTAILVCWKCGASLEGLPLPLGRSAECKACSAYLHVCRLCEFYDPRVAKSCREPVAEEVQDKERANFCDYFQARPGAFVARDDSAARRARAEVEALFGSTAGAGSGGAARDAGSEARQKLEQLFGPARKNGD
jgi:ribosomal protein L40E